MSTLAKLPRRGDLKEADVTKQIKDFMLFRKWRPIRFQRTIVTTATGAFSTGEPGMPDFLFVRYLENPCYAGLSVACWIEMKRSQRGRTAENQTNWHATEEQRGAVVLTARNLVEFEERYYELFGWVHYEAWVDGQREISFR